MVVKDFTQFDAWKKAMKIAVAIHELTKAYPQEEKYELVSQMRRAARSIGANIAEGFGRFTYPDKMHKYVQARGELIEVMNDLPYSESVGYISHDQGDALLTLCSEEHMLLNALVSNMRDLS